MTIKNHRIVWAIIISLVVSACSDVPKQDNNDAAQPVSSEAQVSSPTNTTILPPTDSALATETSTSANTNLTEIEQPLPETSLSELPLVTAGESNVNIRSGPGTDFEIIGKLPAGQNLEIVGRNADSSWWQVSTPDGLGWVAAEVTSASNVNDSIPIANVSFVQIGAEMEKWAKK